MSNRVWQGGAASVSQQNTVTPASVGVGNTFTVTTNGKSITFAATAATVANVTAGLAAAIAASTEPEWQQVSPSDETTLLRLTGPADGTPFMQTSGASGGTATLTTATPVAASGPSFWSVAANWSGGAVPVAADDVTFNDSSTVDCLYGIDQNAVTLGSLTVTGGYTGRIGLPARNDLGYTEYRDRFLQVGVTNPVNVGEGGGNGPSLFRWNAGTVQATLNVFQGVVDFLGSHAGNILNRIGGVATVATGAGDTANLNAIRAESEGGNSFATPGGGSADVTLGAGVTAGALTLAGGSVLSAASLGSALLEDGTLTLIDAAAVTTGPTIHGGTVKWNSTGSLGNVAVFDGGKLDASGDLRPKTANTVTVYKGGEFLDPNKVVTVTTTVQVVGCKLDDVSLDFGSGFNLTRS